MSKDKIRPYVIEYSDKPHFPDSWRVVYEGCLILRIVSNNRDNKNEYPYELITATASDESCPVKNDSDRALIIKAANEAIKKIFSQEEDSKIYLDWYQREYLSIALFDAFKYYDSNDEILECIDIFFEEYLNILKK